MLMQTRPSRQVITNVPAECQVPGEGKRCKTLHYQLLFFSGPQGSGCISNCLAHEPRHSNCNSTAGCPSRFGVQCPQKCNSRGRKWLIRKFFGWRATLPNSCARSTVLFIPAGRRNKKLASWDSVFYFVMSTSLASLRISRKFVASSSSWPSLRQLPFESYANSTRDALLAANRQFTTSRGRLKFGPIFMNSSTPATGSDCLSKLAPKG